MIHIDSILVYSISINDFLKIFQTLTSVEESIYKHFLHILKGYFFNIVIYIFCEFLNILRTKIAL